jgi:hypothetical protein
VRGDRLDGVERLDGGRTAKGWIGHQDRVVVRNADQYQAEECGGRRLTGFLQISSRSSPEFTRYR